MRGIHPVAAKAALALLLAGCVLCQVWAIPWLAGAAVGTFPEAAPLRQPVTALAVLVVAAVELGLLSLWPLLPLLQPSSVIRRRHVACADILAASLLTVVALLAAILDRTSRAQMCPPAVALGLVAGIVASGTGALVVMLYRRRLNEEVRGQQVPTRQASFPPDSVP
ncbi:DUF2975 domain-containing protein [Arthrobacter sp. zg-Y750]|uniref:DUF2975 domain-containing protein n=1 Tax=Arthrobacter sp. zg-Y750 TaxID=2894189 RepID=UPI003FA4569C